MKTPALRAARFDGVVIRYFYGLMV